MKKLALSLMFTAGLVVGSFANENPQPSLNAWQGAQNTVKPLPSVVDPRYFEEGLKKKLNLTDDQATQIREIRKQEMEEIKEFFTRERKSAIEEATRNGGFDEDVFVKTSVENTKKSAEIRAKYLKKILSILNEDQKKAFIEDLKNRDPQKMKMAR